MSKVLHDLSRFSLRIFDFIDGVNEDSKFLTRIIRLSFKGLIISIAVTACFIFMDLLLRSILSLLNNPDREHLKRVADFLININSHIGLKSISQFANAISTIAGILGVIFGLFYTAFITIISTKYAHLDSQIGLQLLKHKNINRYFLLIVTFTATAILTQIAISLGYNPTIVTISIFCLIAAILLVSSVSFGKNALLYLDVSFLVADLLQVNGREVFRFNRHLDKMQSKNEKSRFQFLIYHNLNIIEKIVINISINKESGVTTLGNTAKLLNEFYQFYSSKKQNIPLKQGWHLTDYKYKEWENASEIEFRTLESMGIGLIPRMVEDPGAIEKKVISILLLIIKNHPLSKNKIAIINSLEPIIKLLTFDHNLELLKTLFNELSDLTIEFSTKFPEDSIYYISLYGNLLTICLASQLQHIDYYSEEKITELAAYSHDIKRKRRFPRFSYSLRDWLDSYHEKLRNEQLLEGSVCTPLFYTKFEIAWKLQSLITEFHSDLVKFLIEKENNLLDNLLQDNKITESIEFAITANELFHRITILNDAIKTKLNSLNREFNHLTSPFEFKSETDLVNLSSAFQDKVFTILYIKGTKLPVKEDALMPDFWGTYYHLLINDFLSKLLNKNTIAEKYLKYINVICLQYLNHIKRKYDSNKYSIETNASKVYPTLIDLFEINSIAIIISKLISKDSLINEVFDFWDGYFSNAEEELNYWRYYIAVYNYMDLSISVFSNNSYIKEYDRFNKVKDFLISNGLIIKDTNSVGRQLPFQKYSVKSDDIYLTALANLITYDIPSSFKLNEVFVEVFLKTRISLKEIRFQETRYGEEISRIMGN